MSTSELALYRGAHGPIWHVAGVKMAPSTRIIEDGAFVLDTGVKVRPSRARMRAR